VPKDGETTKRKLRKFILSYRETNGYPPSLDEIAQGLATVKSNVHYHLSAMERSGEVSHHPGRARSWNIVSD